MNIETTIHRIYSSNSIEMKETPDSSVDLVVTSPPYPMIGMWDDMFSGMDPRIRDALDSGKGERAYSLMHQELNRVWAQVARVLKPGGIVCINIGDATRTIDGSFQLYPSHAVISDFFRGIGFPELPSIIWKKPSNSPNKFLGSGTLPAGAYVTLEHEHILIFRKEARRVFPNESEKEARAESSFFWEERNRWFADIWEGLTGTRQKMRNGTSRSRSAAFPFEVPYRLINMYSLIGDIVLDPFSGTGTTSMAAAASCRNSVGYEIDFDLAADSRRRLLDSKAVLNSVITNRISEHLGFIRSESKRGGQFKHYNAIHGFPVKTKPEEKMEFRGIEGIFTAQGSEEVTVDYSRIGKSSDNS